VVGLALDGKRLAWADCRRIHVLDGERDVLLRLPALVDRDACATGRSGSQARAGAEGKLVFAGNSLGWFFATSDRSWHAFALGISSTTSRSSRLLRADRFYDEKANAGLHGGIASDNRIVLWTWPRLSLLGPIALAYCDVYNPEDDRCRVRVRDAAMHASSNKETAALDYVPPAGPIAASSGWIAAAVVEPGTYPQRRRSGPREVVVARLGDGAILARVRSGDPVHAVALSDRLLAIERDERIDLYRLPGGVWLRSVSFRYPRLRTSYRFTGSIAVAASSLIVWSAERVEVVDATSGRSNLVWPTSALHPLESDQRITALATDGERVAWATTSLQGGSDIRVRALSEKEGSD